MEGYELLLYICIDLGNTEIVHKQFDNSIEKKTCEEFCWFCVQC